MQDKPLPGCYYHFRNEVRELKLNAINAVAETIRQTFDVNVMLPSGLKLRFKRQPVTSSYYYIRGAYDPLKKEIVLFEPWWCRRTLVHETLHSLSFFYRDESLIDKSLGEWRFIVEGFTEFFTGYVLYVLRKRFSCYLYWLNRSYLPCRISYEPYVKVLGALAQVLVSLEDLKRLFFYSRQVDWKQLYRSFLKKYELPDLLRDWSTAYELEEAILEALQNTGRKDVANRFEALLNDDLQVILNYDTMKK